MVRRWPYVAAVLLVIGLVVLAVAWPRDEGQPVAAGPTLVLPLPASIGDWTLLDDTDTEREAQALHQAVDERNDDLASAVELFAQDDGARFRITAIVPVVGSAASRELRQDPAARLGEFLASVRPTGRRTFVSGGLGGSLECWTTPGDEFPFACGWADEWALALVRYDQPGLDLDGAADLTRTLRVDLSGAR